MNLRRKDATAIRNSISGIKLKMRESKHKLRLAIKEKRWLDVANHANHLHAMQIAINWRQDKLES